MTWWWLIPALLGAVVTLVLHETSHWICIKVAPNVEVKAFKPWPHKYFGRWLWGAVYCTKDNMGAMEPINHLAPMLKAFVMMPIYILLTCFVVELWPLIAWEIIEICWWWRGWLKGENYDGGRLRRLINGRG